MERPGSARCAIWASIQALSSSMLEATSAWMGVIMKEIVAEGLTRRLPAYADFFYWRLSSGIEVDFVVNNIDCAVEAKAAARVRGEHAKGLRELKLDHPETRRRIVVSLDPHDRTYRGRH